MGNLTELAATANALVAPGKGILAADESSGTIKRRFDAIGVESTEDNRRDYRELLFRTPGAAEFVSGVILYDETIRQKAADGTPLVKVLQSQGIIPGIKVDTGAKALAGADGRAGDRGSGRPARALRRVPGAGRQVQQVARRHHHRRRHPDRLLHRGQRPRPGALRRPEPGSRHRADRRARGADGRRPLDRALLRGYARDAAAMSSLSLPGSGSALEGMLLKPNMVLSGNKAANRAPAEEVARRTVACFKETVPAAVPGIVFLSGGQSDDEATVNLDAINRYAAQVGAPWQLSYSYGRGLQAAPQKAWSGKRENVGAAQKAFYHRAKVTSAARQGKYSREMEKELTAAG